MPLVRDVATNSEAGRFAEGRLLQTLATDNVAADPEEDLADPSRSGVLEVPRHPVRQVHSFTSAAHRRDPACPGIGDRHRLTGRRAPRVPSKGTQRFLAVTAG